jgi:hypothetical protein
MRRHLLPVLLLALVVSACDGSTAPAAAGSTTSAPVGLAPPSSVAITCAEVRRLNNRWTGSLTAQVAEAVAAGERGDPTKVASIIEQIRRTLSDWAGGLRQLADGSADELAAAIAQYAGAIDAARARTTSAADLEKLENFDDQELDAAADRLSGVCP